MGADELTVHNRRGRRQFIRRGASFVAAGGVIGAGVLGTPGKAYAADCDRNGTENKEGTPGSDSDTGASADPAGCGREPEKPKISQHLTPDQPSERAAVEKIKA